LTCLGFDFIVGDIELINRINRKMKNTFEDYYTYVPPHTRDGIINWIEHGIEPGAFLKAVICNNLKEAFGRADDINIVHLKSIVSWFYNHAPSDCWGSPENYEHWIETHSEKRAAQSGG
jgi:hypothetical protein